LLPTGPRAMDENDVLGLDTNFRMTA